MRIGSLFSGYGGLDMAVEQVFGATTAWVSDVDKGACKILAHRYPDVPNLGDITSIDWAAVEPVDIITGGSPCQDLSHAGKRSGMTEGTRSNLWVAMREAIAQVKPSIVVWENVRGAYSATADSDLEHCPGCMGDPADRGLVLRALGRVLGDLSDLGYDTQWHGLRAADVGAAHGRFRVFVVAHRQGVEQRESPITGSVRNESRTSARGHAALSIEHLLPTPTGSDTNGAGQHGDGGLDLRTAVTLLPTPAVNDMGEGKTVEKWDNWTASMREKHGNGNGHGKSLAIEAQRLLPTPTARDHKDHTIRREPHRHDATDTLSRALADVPCALLPTPKASDGEWGLPRTSGRPPEMATHLATRLAYTDFGDYAAAIQRWEHVLGRPAPDPTEPTGRDGAHRLSPKFTEWLMGLPDGWITDVPGITRNEALKACGNGVVPQQAAFAISHLIERAEVYRNV